MEEGARGKGHAGRSRDDRSRLEGVRSTHRSPKLAVANGYMYPYLVKTDRIILLVYVYTR